MARAVLASVIIARGRLAADAVGDTNITDAWLYQKATALVAKLWDIILNHGLGGEGVKWSSFNTVADQIEYDLTATIWAPFGQLIAAGALTDFYKVKTLYVNDGSGLYRPVPRVSPNEHYAMKGPQSVIGMKLYYIPCAPVWTTGSESFDGINGYEEWIVQGLAYAIRVKQEDDGGSHKGEQREIEEQIKSSANRNADEPPRVIRRRTAQAWATRTLPYSGGVGAWDLRGSKIELYTPSVGLYP